MKTTDRCGREVNYIRISVTPRCNLRCAYCHPGGTRIADERQILSLKQIARLAGIFSRAGIKKVRLTGGEPLVRKGMPALIRALKNTAGIDEVTLTTNGVFLENMIGPLKRSGLDRINISLDSLRPERVERITGHDVSAQVMKSVEKIAAGNIWPLKLNVVAVKGVNDDEITDFADLAARRPLEVRFIEMMPSAHNGHFTGKALISAAQIKEAIGRKYSLARLTDLKGIMGPAEVYAIAGGAGKIGFVSPISKHFCGNCNRLRLTAEGNLRACLFSDAEVALKPGLDSGAGDEWFLEKLAESLAGKPDGHNLNSAVPSVPSRPMLSIGG